MDKSTETQVMRKEESLAQEKEEKKDDVEYIYTTYIIKKDGTKVYASQYGIKAFRIPKVNK
mgnify:CR=1 FL=1